MIPTLKQIACCLDAAEINLAREIAARVAATAPQQLVFVGDSISSPETNGLGDASWVRRLPAMFEPLSGADTVELAVPGSTAQAAALAAAWNSYTPPETGGIVFVEFSTNDFAGGRTAAQLVADLQTICLGWKSRGYKVCLLSPVRWFEPQVPDAFTLLRAATWYDWLVDVTTGGYEINDYVHPTARGSQQIAKAVASTLGGTNTPYQLVKLPIGTALSFTGATGNPATLTATAHGLTTGDLVYISGSTGYTPAINGVHAVTVTGASTFTIPVAVTVAGSGGTINKGVALFRGRRLNWETTTWIIHLNSPILFGDMQTYVASALTGYSGPVFTLLPIAYAPVTGPNPVVSGLARLNVDFYELFLINNNTSFAYTVDAAELFTS